MMKLSEGCALVTGGAVRIGRAIVEMLADAGCGVIIHYHRSASEAKALSDRLGRKVRTVLVSGDLAHAAECRRIIDDAWRQTGGFNILINNASVFHKDTLATATGDALEAEWQVNVAAPMTLTRAFADHWCAGRSNGPLAGASDAPVLRGHVIHLLDRRIAGVDPACLPYEMSKKMLAAFMHQSALELAPAIAVNGVAPGAILPPRSEGASAGGTVRDLAGPTALQGPCGPEAVAAAVRFLLESDGITGQVLFVDNGRHLFE